MAEGIATPVRRQDDYGFDFHCQLSDQESGYLTFGYPYTIQIKSNSEVIEYGQKNPDKWKFENISWLFRNEIPFFIGIVDRKEISISIYDTTGLWQVYNHPTYAWSQIELKPTINDKDKMRENCEVIVIEDWNIDKGDGRRYVVDMGNPIIRLTYDDLEDNECLKHKKAILRAVIKEEQINIIHRNLGVTAFSEIKENTINDFYLKKGMAFNSRGAESVSAVYASFSIGLISLLPSLALQGRTEECGIIKNLLRYFPKADYYSQLYDQNPDLYDWTKNLIE